MKSVQCAFAYVRTHACSVQLISTSGAWRISAWRSCDARRFRIEPFLDQGAPQGGAAGAPATGLCAGGQNRKRVAILKVRGVHGEDEQPLCARWTDVQHPA